MISSKELSLLEVGCKVRTSKNFADKEIIELKFDIPNPFICLSGGSWCRPEEITKILSWPIPKKFNTAHIGHWIKIKEGQDIPSNLCPSNYKDYYGKWFKIAELCRYRPDIRIDNSHRTIIEPEVIAEYCPIEPVIITTPKLTLKDAKLGDFVKLKDCAQIAKVKDTWKSGYVCECSYGNVYTRSYDLEVEKIISVWGDIPLDYYVELSAYWYQRRNIHVVLNKFEEIQAIRTKEEHKDNGTFPTAVEFEPGGICDESWNALKRGMFIKIANDDYIAKHISGNLNTFKHPHISYFKESQKDLIHGTWQEIDFTEDHSRHPHVTLKASGFGIDRGLITGICNSDPTKPKHTPMIMPESPIFKMLYTKIKEDKQEKIMLNTLEEIKAANLDEKNLDAGAADAARILDEEEKNIVKDKILTLSREKKDWVKQRNVIDEHISRVDKLLAALKYPPVKK